MKKYTTLPVDFTSLISDVQTYVQENIVPDEIFVWLGKRQLSEFGWTYFASQVPSIETTFSELNLTVEGCGYRMVEGTKWIRPNVFAESVLIVPTINEPCMITLYQPNENAVKVSTWFYHLSSCTEIESFLIDQPLLIGPEVAYMIRVVDTSKKVPFLHLPFTTTDVEAFLA